MKKQPIKGVKKVKNEVKKVKKLPLNKRQDGNKKQKYGTSKLEQYFAKEYLDKLGLKYIYEYEAKKIQRFYDFAIVQYPEVNYLTEEKHGIKSIKQDGQITPISFCIEVDGNYWHSNPNFVDVSKLTPTQKHNKYVDFLKDKWCENNGIPLVRIWEEDIRKNPKKVFEQLEIYIHDAEKKQKIKELKKKPH